MRLVSSRWHAETPATVCRQSSYKLTQTPRETCQFECHPARREGRTKGHLPSRLRSLSTCCRVCVEQKYCRVSLAATSWMCCRENERLPALFQEQCVCFLGDNQPELFDVLLGLKMSSLRMQWEAWLIKLAFRRRETAHRALMCLGTSWQIFNAWNVSIMKKKVFKCCWFWSTVM